MNETTKQTFTRQNEIEWLKARIDYCRKESQQCEQKYSLHSQSILMLQEAHQCELKLLFMRLHGNVKCIDMNFDPRPAKSGCDGTATTGDERCIPE